MNLTILEFLVEDYELLSKLMPYLAKIFTTNKVSVGVITSFLFVSRIMSKYGFILEDVRDGRMALICMCEEFKITIKRVRFNTFYCLAPVYSKITFARHFNTEHEIMEKCEDVLQEHHTTLCITSSTDSKFMCVLHKTDNIITIPRGAIICLR